MSAWDGRAAGRALQGVREEWSDQGEMCRALPVTVLTLPSVQRELLGPRSVREGISCWPTEQVLPGGGRGRNGDVRQSLRPLYLLVR